MLCFALFLQILYKCILYKLKDPKVRPSARNSLGKSFQSFAPVNLQVDWPVTLLKLCKLRKKKTIKRGAAALGLALTRLTNKNYFFNLISSQV